MNARDLMVQNVMTVTPDTTVAEIARVLTTYRLGSVPVVDDGGHLVGIVSESDLFLKEKGIPYSAVKLPERFQQWVDAGRLAQIYEGARTHTAADVMTRCVHALPEDAPLSYAVSLLAHEDVAQVPVVTSEGTVTGICHALDLLRWFADGLGYKLTKR